LSYDLLLLEIMKMPSDYTTSCKLQNKVNIWDKPLFTRLYKEKNAKNKNLIGFELFIFGMVFKVICIHVYIS